MGNAIIMLENYQYARHLADILKIENRSVFLEEMEYGGKSHFQN